MRLIVRPSDLAFPEMVRREGMDVEFDLNKTVRLIEPIG
jgi:hypothetical protein